TNLWGTRCGALCARDVIARGGGGAPIINAGQMLTLRRRGCLALWPPLRQMANPQRGKTTNRRAGCGRTACPVRREGGPKPISSSYPYQGFSEEERICAAKEWFSVSAFSFGFKLWRRLRKRKLLARHRQSLILSAAPHGWRKAKSIARLPITTSPLLSTRNLLWPGTIAVWPGNARAISRALSKISTKPSNSIHATLTLTSTVVGSIAIWAPPKPPSMTSIKL